MLTWYEASVEITSPGGPYGAVTAASFGAGGLSELCNPTVGDAAKAMNFIQRLGSGTPRARGIGAKRKSPAGIWCRAEFRERHRTSRAMKTIGWGAITWSFRLALICSHSRASRT